ncbi:MAG TPA: hypothetical protein VIC06_13375 [Solirubrobacteraceae bacterium]
MTTTISELVRSRGWNEGISGALDQQDGRPETTLTSWLVELTEVEMYAPLENSLNHPR